MTGSVKCGILDLHPVHPESCRMPNDDNANATDTVEMAASSLGRPGLNSDEEFPVSHDGQTRGRFLPGYEHLAGVDDSTELRPDGAAQPNRPRDLMDTAAKMAEIRALSGSLPSVPPLPAWLIDADAEELRELEALGVVASPEFKADAERDELISRLMRSKHEYDADVERYDQAEALEHAAITRRYDRLRAPAKRQMARLGAFITYLVTTVTFSGKAKSRSVGWGSFGRRKQPDVVDVVNMLEVVAALRKTAPTVVKIEVTTNADVQAKADAIITTIIDGTAQIDGTAVSVLSELRAQLRGGAAKVSKVDVGHLLKANQEIPGAAITIGVDKPWYEVEPPANG